MVKVFDFGAFEILMKVGDSVVELSASDAEKLVGDLLDAAMRQRNAEAYYQKYVSRRKR